MCPRLKRNYDIFRVGTGPYVFNAPQRETDKDGYGDVSNVWNLHSSFSPFRTVSPYRYRHRQAATTTTHGHVDA